MAINNPHFLKLQSAITPIVSIGVGSAICTACMKIKLDPAKIENKDLAKLKNALIEHYKQFWGQKIKDIENALGPVI